jgi:hypothetical protein
MKIFISNNIFGDYFTTKKYSTTEENENAYTIEFSTDDSKPSKDLEVNTKTDEKNDEKLVSILVSNNLKRMRKECGGGFDQRKIGKTRLEKIYDEVQENTTLEKLRKYNYQMKLLKKLQNSDVSEFEKIKAIDDYNYLMESSKYISNIEAGGLYKNWSSYDF